MDPSSSLDDKLANDHQIPKPSYAEESTSISVHITSQDGVEPENHLTEKAETNYETEKVQNGKRKYKQKKDINLPCRASKRLAGIKVDPILELGKNKRGRVAINQSCEGKMMTSVDQGHCCLTNDSVKQYNAVEGRKESKSKFDSTTNKIESVQSEYCYERLPTLEGLTEKTVEEHEEWISSLHLEDQRTYEEYMRVLEDGEKVGGNLDYSLGLPLGEILKYPCIAFAVRILTGVTSETDYENSHMPSEFMNIKPSDSETLAASEGKSVDLEQEGCKKEISTPENVTVPNECGAADKIGKRDKGKENSGPSWMDPVQKFAIKTITDSCSTIPLDTDSSFKNSLYISDNSARQFSTTL